MKYTIGIDLGGTTMTAGLVDEAYNIVGKITRPTRLARQVTELGVSYNHLTLLTR